MTTKTLADTIPVWFFRVLPSWHIAKDELGNPFLEFDADSARNTAQSEGWEPIRTSITELLTDKENADDIRRYLNNPKFSMDPMVHRNDILTRLMSY